MLNPPPASTKDQNETDQAKKFDARGDNSINEDDDDLSNLPDYELQDDEDEDGFANTSLNDIDKQNNNYLASSPSKSDSKTDSVNSSLARPRTLSDFKKNFQLGDIMEFVHNGLEVCLSKIFFFKLKTVYFKCFFANRQS